MKNKSLEKKKIKTIGGNKVNRNPIIDRKSKAIELWRETRGHVSNLCAGVGISRKTFYDWMKEDKEFATAIVNAEWELHDDVRDALIQKVADGDVSAIKYYLDRKHPDFRPQPTTLIQNNFGEYAKEQRNKYE